MKRGRSWEQRLGHKENAGDMPCLDGQADRPQRRLEASLLWKCSPEATMAHLVPDL